VDNNKLLWLDDRIDTVNHDVAPTLSFADMEWNERFESLLNFGDEFGHCNVPLKREYPLPSGTKIAILLLIYLDNLWLSTSTIILYLESVSSLIRRQPCTYR
jgi:hypothetical protein